MTSFWALHPFATLNALSPSPTAIVAYLALFATVGFLFAFVCLLLGKFLRPRTPTLQKLEIYECGEPSVGPGTVQFDLRFYVVALLFLIFEVEVALFFPTASVFGTVNRARQQVVRPVVAERQERQLPVHVPTTSGPSPTALTPAAAHTLALVSMLDLGVFFAVLLVGFAYVWRQGDLDWVRAVRHPATSAEATAAAVRLRQDGVLS